MKKQQNKRLDKLITICNCIITKLFSCVKCCFSNKIFSFFKIKQPYIKLMRLDKPAGYILLMLPVLWTVVICSENILQVILYSAFFALGACIMRSAGCVINDIIDRKIDKSVQRTKNRPLVSGELTIKQALIVLTLLLLIAAGMLSFLPHHSIRIGIIALCLIILYPFAKRKSYYPQIFLGITFNWVLHLI